MALAYLTINLDAFTGDDHPPVSSYSTITLDPGADHIDAASDVIHVRTIVVSLDRQGKAATANGVPCVDGKVPVVAGVAYAVSAPNVLRGGPHYIPALTAGQVVDLSDYITPGAPLTPDQAATLTARIVVLEAGGGGGGGGYLDHGNQVGAVTYAASTGTHRLTSTGATTVSLTGANGDIVSIYDDGVGPLTVEGTLVTVPGAVVCHRVAGVWYAYPLGATTPSDPSDVTPPAPGSMAASAITDTGFTLTVTGADDAGGLHATPYAFSTDGGATLSAWQSSPVFVASGLTPSTPYSCRWSVRDAALNVSTGTAFTVTTTAVATDVTAPAWSATFTMGTPTLTNVTATASALATDAVGVTGYEVSYNDGTTWDAITPAGSVFTLAGTQGSTYATTKLRARDAAGNRSTPALSVPSYTLASVIPAVGNPATLQEAATLWGAEGYWKLDETTGTTMTDSSGKGRHGTISGTAPTDYTLGTAAGLLHVESLGKVIVPDDDAYSIGTYGLSVFAVFRQAGNMTTRAFITKLNEWQTGLANNTTKFTSQSDRSSGSPAGLSTMDNAFTTATWHAFATAIPKPDSGSQPKPTIWIDNGTPQAVTSSYTVGTVSANTTQTLSLGGNWVGDIGHVMIFPFALTNAHVAKLTDLARSQGLIP